MNSERNSQYCEVLALLKNGTRFWPGLGRSDSDYALVLTSYPLFEVATTPLAGALLHRLPYSITITVFIIVYVAGGVVYSLARSLWVAFVGFGLFGMGSALASVTVHTYMGEMGTVMDQIRKKQGKKPRKYILYVAFSFVVNGGFLPALAMNSIIAQFDVNPYHWPGWAQASLSASVGLLTLLFFVETRSLSQAKTSCSNAVSCLAGIKLEAQLQTKCSKLASYMFLCGCGFLGGMMFTIVSALAPPVLSDQFGFDVENTSHYLLVMSSAYLISSILQLAAKCARIDNRKILGLGIIFAMAGSVMFGDWQAVHNDPCHFPPTSNSTANSFPSSTLYTSGENATDALCLGDSVTNSSYLQGLVQSCEDLSSSSNECFWNRQSRVTSTYCYTCLGVCLSLQKSQNIYQLSMGVMLLSISAGFLFVFSSAVVSDVASVKSQGKVVSSVIGAGSLARCISPLWFIKSYEMTSRHSYFAMAITAGYALVLLICLAALFKNLAPRDRGSALSATSKFHSYPVDQDPTGSGEIAEVQDDDDLENQTFPFETTV